MKVVSQGYCCPIYQTATNKDQLALIRAFARLESIRETRDRAEILIETRRYSARRAMYYAADELGTRQYLEDGLLPRLDCITESDSNGMQSIRIIWKP